MKISLMKTALTVQMLIFSLQLSGHLSPVYHLEASVTFPELSSSLGAIFLFSYCKLQACMANNEEKRKAVKK